jgi:hypothetical protein
MTREPKQLVMAAARSGGNPNDAVVALDERGVHWGPALMRVLEGRYCLQLSQLPAGTSGGDATALLDWDRAVDAEGVASTPGVSPGLHALQKGSPGSNGSCEFDADGTTAWVLVVPAPEFQRLDAAWKQQAVSIADLERGGISLATATTVRHAVLADLAATVAAP